MWKVKEYREVLGEDGKSIKREYINLKELEKFGFMQITYYPAPIEYFKKVYLANDEDDRICYHIFEVDRFIRITRLDGEELDGTLYDLIKADLVEKVEV